VSRLPRPIDAVLIGVGDTDYRVDWDRHRAGQPTMSSSGLARLAFCRAIEDAGITYADVDGLYVGVPLTYEPTAEMLGLNVRWASGGDSAQAVQDAAYAIDAGAVDCVALVHGNDQRSRRVAYGGPGASYGDQFLSYVYYEPWGLTSQGALYALVAQRYLLEFGHDETMLAEVAVAQRMHALLNPNAVMREPLTAEDYLASRHIVEPLRLFDYTLVNDGGVALVMASREFAECQGLLDRAVQICGLGRSDLNVGATSLEPRLVDYYHPAHTQAATASPSTCPWCWPGLVSPRTRPSASSSPLARSAQGANCQRTPREGIFPRATCRAGGTTSRPCGSCAAKRATVRFRGPSTSSSFPMSLERW
jgi:acetyl-CoA acetyltransferase